MSRQWQIWFGFFLLMAFIYATRAVLLPFVAGLAIAYLLDPLADKLESRKFPEAPGISAFAGMTIIIT